jgi:hypothetical protein
MMCVTEVDRMCRAFENISVLGRAVSVTFAKNIITDIPRTNLAVPRGGNA